MAAAVSTSSTEFSHLSTEHFVLSSFRWTLSYPTQCHIGQSHLPPALRLSLEPTIAPNCLGFQGKISNHLSGLEVPRMPRKSEYQLILMLGLQPGTESRFTNGRAWEEWAIIRSLLPSLLTQELRATKRRQWEPGSKQLKCGGASHRH